MAIVAETPAICGFCNSEVDAKFFCVNCDKSLCAKCKLDHSKRHEIISNSASRHKHLSNCAVTMCNEHIAKELSMFCIQCEQFICVECVDEKHEGHKVTSSKKITKKHDELVDFMGELKNQKVILNKTLDTENNVHSQSTECYANLKKHLSDHVTNIIDGVTTLQQEENQRHSDACNNIQSQTRALTTAIQLVQTAIDSGIPATMEKAKSNATQLVQNFNDVPSPQIKTTIHRPRDINRSTDVFSKDKGARPKDPQTEVTNKRHDDVPDTQQSPNVNQCKIDFNNVKVISKIKVKDKKYYIKLIVPIESNRIWVAAEYDKHLTLITTDGVTVKQSVDVCDGDRSIIDAKIYNEALLVTCFDNREVIRLSSDGECTTIFSDMSPYYPYGLCVTRDKNIVLCLKSTYYRKDNDTRVVILDNKGQVIQIMQKDYQGAALYSCPSRVTSLPTGEILVSDKDQHMRVLCVNSLGHQMFTWNGEVEGRKVDKFEVWCITHDKYNNVFITDRDNHRVFTLSRDGSQAQCLLDSTYGIKYPYGLALESEGKLWLGCDEGKIHVVQY